MKHFYILILTILASNLQAQTIINEDFESATANATTFTSNGQVFNITTLTPDNSFTIKDIAGNGWNGTAPDNRFIDNSTSIVNGQNPSFSIKTNDGNPFQLKSFWFFLSSDNGGTANGDLRIVGKLNGQFRFGNTFAESYVDNLPVSGGFFKKLDFNFTSGSTYIDEFIISTSDNVYNIELDALEWSPLIILGVQDYTLNRSNIFIFPNPSTDFIQLSGLVKTQQYTIYNVLGVQIHNGNISLGEKIDIQDLTNGIYFMKLDNGNTIKFMKD